jgi:hypothetical protein
MYATVSVPLQIEASSDIQQKSKGTRTVLPVRFAGTEGAKLSVASSAVIAGIGSNKQGNSNYYEII